MLHKLHTRLSHRQALALMVLITFLWSIAGVVSRQLESAKGFETTFWRSLFTALSLLVLLPLLMRSKDQPGADANAQVAAGVESKSLNAMSEPSAGTYAGRAWLGVNWRSKALWLSGACWGVMFTAYMLALSLTSVANVLITMALGPLFTALVSRAFIGQRIPARTWWAIGVAGLGIAYMYAAQLSGSGKLTGTWVALCVPLAAAVQWTLTQSLQNRSSHAEKVDLVPAVLVGALISCAVTLPLAFPFAATGPDIAWLALLGLVQLAIPCALSVVCARVLSGPEVSLLALLEIIFGISLVWAFAGESPGERALLGGALVLGALVVNEWLAAREKARRLR